MAVVDGSHLFDAQQSDIDPLYKCVQMIDDLPDYFPLGIYKVIPIVSPKPQICS